MTATGRLEGRAALVTGAGSGIGAATAVRLAAEGADVICADISADAALRTATSIGAAAHAIEHDVTDRGSWEQVARTCAGRLGRLDILVNSAGFTRDRSLLKMTDSEWLAVIDVHLRGTWLGCQHAVALMRAGGGSIVNVSSESRHGSFGQANYAAAKAGIVGLTRTVALEHARHAIRCNTIAPGMVRTPLIASVPDDIKQQLRARIPLSRFAEPEEIAAAIAFLASSDASYITGQTLNCDGGTTWS